MMAKPNKREQKVSRAMFRGLAAVMTVAVVGVVVGVLARSSGNSFLSGMQSGMMAGLPWVVLAMVWGGYRQMDEYAKLNMLRAASVSFAALMLLAMTYFPLEQALKLPPMPLWILWVVGWATWGVTLGVVSRSRGD